MLALTPQTHLEKIRSLAKDKSVMLIDAVHHYTEFNALDPYFIADIIHTDKQFLSEIQREAKSLKLIK